MPPPTMKLRGGWSPEVHLGEVRQLAQHVEPITIRNGNNEIEAQCLASTLELNV
jgi:hypothetical protein